MSTMTIRDIPEPYMRMLRDRAVANHRSLNGEVNAILAAALGAAPRRNAGTPPPGRPLKLPFVISVDRPDAKDDREEIYADDTDG